MAKEKKPATQKYSLRLTTNALRNIDEITGYIAFINFQPLNAIKTGDLLFETISRIEQHPFAFRECEALPTKAKMYRRAVCLSWIIIYKVISTAITILGVIHSARNPSGIKLLKKVK